jgi:hypothetical protein
MCRRPTAGLFVIAARLSGVEAGDQPESPSNRVYGTALPSGYCQIKDDGPKLQDSEIGL